MYYELDDIENKLQCILCKKRIDIPKLLPCGYTTCNKCSDDILIKSNIMIINDIELKNGEFYCLICKSIHQIPINGFPIQKLVLELLNLKSIKIYRSGAYSKLETLLKEFQINLFKLNSIIKKPECYLIDYCELVRDKVKKLTQKRINELNGVKDKLLSDIDKYEENCICKLKDNDFINIKNYNDLIKNYEININEWNVYLKKGETSEQYVCKILQDAENLNNEILCELNKIEKILFNSFKISFNDLKSQMINNDTIGLLEYKAL